MANPILPLWECIPDGEPRQFGDRVYLYGSHDRFGCDKFCDYKLKAWSAPLSDLDHWTCHGHIFQTRPDTDHESSVPHTDHELYAPDVVEKYRGVCYPAHVDREANGIIATLGTFPEEPVFRFAEFNNNANIEPYRKCYPVLADKPCLVSSDAHYLENMREAQHFFELEGENEKEILESLFKKLRAGIGE